MPIDALWLQEPFIRLVRYEDVVTTEDFEALVAQEWVLFENSRNQIVVVLDAENITKLAVNPLRIPRFMKLIKHPKLVCCLMVANNPTSSFWAKTISQIVKHPPLHVTSSVDDAVKFAAPLLASLV